MKIKELFSKMEQANKFAAMVGDSVKYELEIAICEEQYFDWYFAKSFKNFKDFQKYCNSEYIENYRKEIFNTEIEMDESGNGEGQFLMSYWWEEETKKHLIKVHFWRR